jgi:hypothetical protein
MRIDPAAGRDDVAAVDLAKQDDHRLRGGGIADVEQVAWGRKQLRDGAVDADAAQLVEVDPLLHFARPTKVADQHVGRAIAAVDQHGFQQLPGRQRADPVVKRAAAVIDLREISGRNRHLHRAGHRIGLVTADADHLAAVEVKRGQADVARAGGQQRLELNFEAFQGRRRIGKRGLRGKGSQPAQDGSNNAHVTPC